MYQNSDMETFGQRLKARRKELKLTQKQICAKVGMSQGNLSELENDEYPSSSFTPQLAHALGVSAMWLAEGRGSKFSAIDRLVTASALSKQPEDDCVEPPFEHPDDYYDERLHENVEASDLEQGAELRPSRSVPLVGEVQGGNDGYLLELEYPVGHGEGTVEWPTRDANAYALRVRGDSMHPRYRAGEFVIVEPSIEPQPQDDVVVLCVDGRKMLKLLNWISDDEVQLLSLNNGYAPITLKRSEIRSIQLASGRAPRSALRKP